MSKRTEAIDELIAAEVLEKTAEANAAVVHWRAKYEHEVAQHVKTLTGDREDAAWSFRCGFWAAVAAVGGTWLAIEIIRLLM
jgi:hypothetical protein